MFKYTKMVLQGVVLIRLSLDKVVEKVGTQYSKIKKNTTIDEFHYDENQPKFATQNKQYLPTT